MIISLENLFGFFRIKKCDTCGKEKRDCICKLGKDSSFAPEEAFSGKSPLITPAMPWDIPEMNCNGVEMVLYNLDEETEPEIRKLVERIGQQRMKYEPEQIGKGIKITAYKAEVGIPFGEAHLFRKDEKGRDVFQWRVRFDIKQSNLIR